MKRSFDDSGLLVNEPAFAESDARETSRLVQEGSIGRFRQSHVGI